MILKKILAMLLAVSLVFYGNMNVFALATESGAENNTPVEDSGVYEPQEPTDPEESEEPPVEDDEQEKEPEDPIEDDPEIPDTPAGENTGDTEEGENTPTDDENGSSDGSSEEVTDGSDTPTTPDKPTEGESEEEEEKENTPAGGENPDEAEGENTPADEEDADKEEEEEPAEEDASEIAAAIDEALASDERLQGLDEAILAALKVKLADTELELWDTIFEQLNPENREQLKIDAAAALSASSDFDYLDEAGREELVIQMMVTPCEQWIPFLQQVIMDHLNNPAEEEEEELVVKTNPIFETLTLNTPVEADEQGNITLPEDGSLIDLFFPAEIDGVEITKISDNAFRGCPNFRTVLISDIMEEIGDNAFAECVGLEYIVLLDRYDAEDMILGKNWNGDAEVIFGLVQAPANDENPDEVIEEEPETEETTEPVEEETEVTENSDDSASAETAIASDERLADLDEDVMAALEEYLEDTDKSLWDTVFEQLKPENREQLKIDAAAALNASRDFDYLDDDSREEVVIRMMVTPRDNWLPLLRKVLAEDAEEIALWKDLNKEEPVVPADAEPVNKEDFEEEEDPEESPDETI